MNKYKQKHSDFYQKFLLSVSANTRQGDAAMSFMKGDVILMTLFYVLSGAFVEQIDGQDYSVTYASNNICGLRGSFVDIPCTYSYPSGHQIIEAFWHLKQGRVDLSQDSRYQGRVEYLGDKRNNCSLRIKNLSNRYTREQYRFRFITDDSQGKYSGSEVSLTLTDLHVSVRPEPVKKGNEVTLTCSTTCSLSNNPTYIWYRNSQPLSYSHITSSNTLSIPTFNVRVDAGYYSCALRGHEGHPSPSVCVLSCWSVTYTPQSICALKGSSVELHSYYTYPRDQTIMKTLWFITWPHNREPDDLIDDDNYQGRVTYTGDNKNSHTLSISNLTVNDSNKYRFRVISQEGEMVAGSDLHLSVTELQVVMSPVTVKEGDNVTLTCNTTCSLSNNPTYIWYRNSQPVYDLHNTDNQLAIDSVCTKDAGKYSCAVKRHEIHSSPAITLSVRYAPRNTSASVRPSGEPVEGSSVTLTCSSDANPPAHYTWYKMLNDRSSQAGLSQNHSFTNINSEQSGLYYCVAENEIGNDTSSVVQINVTYAPRNTSASVSPSVDIEEGSSVTLTCSSDANPPVHNYTWYRGRHGSESIWLAQGWSYSITNISAEHSGLYYCKAENNLGASKSNGTFLDVFYSPRMTSASLSPSDDLHHEGNSVTLTCSSDANPPVHTYTWYRKTGDGTVLLGTERMPNLTLHLVSGVDGLYHCEAQNKVGSNNSTAVRIFLPDSGLRSTILFSALGAILAVILLLVIVIVCWRQVTTETYF
ncbi:B-cell receptor CD22-like [Sardina pilchardus]|uniref:B-cell receptor CD22-like n=1 Tax=Sardina pilchardus TaxID=27697 RepID=UPI002E154C40